MHRIATLALFSAALFAQNPDNPFDRPPAKVDKALRERVGQFYQFHIDQQFRKAETLVAEDTKEFFYSRNKPAYVSCRFGKVQYSENYTRAKVMELCEQYVMIPGFANKPLLTPIPSTWKIVRGKWYWYVDPEALKQSPFGKLNPGTAGAGNPGLPQIPASAAGFLNQVRPDKSAVSLKPGESAQVTIGNHAPGLMTLQIADSLPGVEAKLDRNELKIGESAVLTLRAGEATKTSGVLNIRVEQTTELIPIRIDVK